MTTVFREIEPEEAQFLGSAFPQYVKALGTNYPVPGLAFDAATLETAFFKFLAENYGSGNLTLRIDWYAATATSGDVVFGAAIACITPNTDTQDIETKAFATATTVTDTHLGTTGKREHTTSITISNLDALTNGDDVRLKLYRDAANGADTMTGDAIVTGLEISYSDT